MKHVSFSISRLLKQIRAPGADNNVSAFTINVSNAGFLSLFEQIQVVLFRLEFQRHPCFKRTNLRSPIVRRIDPTRSQANPESQLRVFVPAESMAESSNANAMAAGL